MATHLLKGLTVTKISLVEEGADDEAHIKLFKHKKPQGGTTVMNLEEILKAMKPEHKAVVEEAIAKAKNEIPEEEKKKLEAAEAEVAKAKKELEDTKSELAKAKPELDEEEVLKSLDPGARALIEKARAQAAAAEVAVAKMRDEAIEAEVIAKARTFQGLGTEEAEMKDVLKGLKSKDEALYTSVCDVLKTAQNLVATGDIFKEAGSSRESFSGSSDDAWAKIEKAAEEVAKAKNISLSSATTEVIKAKPELYNEYIEAQNAGR